MEIKCTLVRHIHRLKPIGNLHDPECTPCIEGFELVDSVKLGEFRHKKLEVEFGGIWWKIQTCDSSATNGEGVWLPVGPDEGVCAVEGYELGLQRLNLDTSQAANERRIENNTIVVIGIKMLVPFFS